MNQDGSKSLNDLRNLLKALADQLDDSDEDRMSTARNSFGQMAPSYLVAISAPAAEQGKAAEIITQVMAMRLDQVKAVITVVDGLLQELAQGLTVDYKKIQYPGIEEILA